MMKTIVVVVAVIGLGGVASAKPAATTIAAADLKWTDVKDRPGAHMAVADGDPAKGASHFYIKFDKGFASPDHHHTADHFITVVSGTYTLTIDGKDVSLPPGSFFSFTGKKPHAAKCDPAAECVLFVDARGKWDTIPEKPAAKPAGKPAVK